MYVIYFSINLSLNSSKKITSSSFTSSATGKTPTKRSDCKTKKTPSKGTRKSPSKIVSIRNKYNKQNKIFKSLLIKQVVSRQLKHLVVVIDLFLQEPQLILN